MSDITPTWGFWAGIVTGIILGVFVGSVALVGQGIWEHGKFIGEMTCKEGRG